MSCRCYLGECCEECAEKRKTSEKIENLTKRIKELEESLPRCVGEWIGGSGGHSILKPCGKLATWEDPDCMYRYTCDDHKNILTTGNHDPDELPWADYVRKFVNKE